MKVSELIELLQEQNPDDGVVMSNDSEGNSYSPLDEISQDVYVPKTTWNGYIKIRELTPGLRKRGYSEGDLDQTGNGQNCITLWPVN